jgi:hypothetical protein
LSFGDLERCPYRDVALDHWIDAAMKSSAA